MQISELNSRFAPALLMFETRYFMCLLYSFDVREDSINAKTD